MSSYPLPVWHRPMSIGLLKSILEKCNAPPLSCSSGYHIVLPNRDSSEFTSGSWETPVMFAGQLEKWLGFQCSSLLSALSPQAWAALASNPGDSCQAFPMILLKIPLPLGDKKHYPLFTKVEMHSPPTTFFKYMLFKNGALFSATQAPLFASDGSEVCSFWLLLLQVLHQWSADYLATNCREWELYVYQFYEWIYTLAILGVDPRRSSYKSYS